MHADAVKDKIDPCLCDGRSHRTGYRSRWRVAICSRNPNHYNGCHQAQNSNDYKHEQVSPWQVILLLTSYP